MLYRFWSKIEAKSRNFKDLARLEQLANSTQKVAKEQKQLSISLLDIFCLTWIAGRQILKTLHTVHIEKGGFLFLWVSLDWLILIQMKLPSKLTTTWSGKVTESLKYFLPRGKKNIRTTFKTTIFPAFEISRLFIPPPVQHGEKSGKFEKPEKIVVFKVFLIFFSL